MADDDTTADGTEDEPTVLTPHVFKPGGDNETCAECGRFADDSLHSPASITAHENAQTSGEDD